MAAKLTGKQKRFADEYLIDLNATAAYGRAGYTAKGKAAEAAASRLLSNVKVQEYIQQRMKEREQRTEITQDMVLERWWAIATADPNELIHLRRLCCRHCFGINHEYQWLDENEFMAAMKAEVEAARLEDREPVMLSDAGGYGFDRLLRPHPKCPACRGEGRPDLHMSDTRDLTGPAKLLYAGIKQTQAGIEIKMQDQGKALENVARHLGMFKDKVELTGKDGEPLQVIFNIPRPPKTE
ncbi:terminase small subunit [Paenibacillus sp. GYB004]|uniref:terminase small subunit n=1 Tax=Paenibacillus sp. GYB004 TaxID=2994393 RepID=UPI002F967EBF